MTKDPQIIEDWLSKVNDEGVNLTKWEEDFIESLSDQWAMRKNISDKQEEILERIYTNKVP
jgi:hypothetical protein